ncbi:putative membrane-associated kinase regulator 4 [Sesamum angolense]|uniref:Membrane-associated kinase regulator 4 n=1 Tax=Sesamum angolense TaxID=2727404 RepID=A0AAE1WFM9_9LAMI|nr:putative membrane-associated kinase regulator 4 [Sesamum angolense]
MPFVTFSTSPCTNSTNTLLDSCDVSPSESCRVSSERNPDDLFEWSSELCSFIKSHPTNPSWSKKLKLIKHTILAQKLKASRAYLKSLFTKSVCSNELCTKADCNAVAASLSKAEAHISRASCPKIATTAKNEERIEAKSRGGRFLGRLSDVLLSSACPHLHRIVHPVLHHHRRRRLSHLVRIVFMSYSFLGAAPVPLRLRFQLMQPLLIARGLSRSFIQEIQNKVFVAFDIFNFISALQSSPPHLRKYVKFLSMYNEADFIIWQFG